MKQSDLVGVWQQATPDNLPPKNDVGFAQSIDVHARNGNTGLGDRCFYNFTAKAWYCYSLHRFVDVTQWQKEVLLSDLTAEAVKGEASGAAMRVVIEKRITELQKKADELIANPYRESDKLSYIANLNTCSIGLYELRAILATPPPQAQPLTDDEILKIILRVESMSAPKEYDELGLSQNYTAGFYTAVRWMERRQTSPQKTKE